MKQLKKPKIKMSFEGVTGNKWRAYTVNVEGKDYHHQNKQEALRQFNAAKRLYLKKKQRQ
jgi:hypothetical protein